mmetsp:Transcript_12547/g.27864  ORF Transcript_12547/g.27864 Transcript_12547/m.27864 type:complete len:213 (+) Transcript_12547:91-729(+)
MFTFLLIVCILLLSESFAGPRPAIKRRGEERGGAGREAGSSEDKADGGDGGGSGMEQAMGRLTNALMAKKETQLSYRERVVASRKAVRKSVDRREARSRMTEEEKRQERERERERMQADGKKNPRYVQRHASIFNIKDPNSDPSRPQNPKDPKSRFITLLKMLLFVVFFTLAVVGLVSGGGYLFRRRHQTLPTMHQVASQARRMTTAKSNTD